MIWAASCCQPFQLLGRFSSWILGHQRLDQQAKAASMDMWYLYTGLTPAVEVNTYIIREISGESPMVEVGPLCLEMPA